MPPSLHISIVTYAPNLPLLIRVLQELVGSITEAQQRRLLQRVNLTLIDNSPCGVFDVILRLLEIPALTAPLTSWTALTMNCNVGYGMAHNLALQPHGDFHLVLNPDVLLARDALAEGIAFMQQHPDVGLINPSAVDKQGNAVALCKRYPSIAVLLLRGFAPRWLQRRFQLLLDRYELRDEDHTLTKIRFDVPLASGCCLLIRRSVFAQVNGFSKDYFLYFEDFDLSLRLRAIARLAYVPTMRIVHTGGHAARKGWFHIALFVRSAVTFFNQHGWRWC